MMAAKSSKPRTTSQVTAAIAIKANENGQSQGYVALSQFAPQKRPPQKKHNTTILKHTSNHAAYFTELSIAFFLFAIALPYQLNTGLT